MAYRSPSILCLFDLEDGGRPIWISHIAAMHNNIQDSPYFMSYTFEQNAANNITIILSIPVPQISHSYLHVLRLEIPPENGSPPLETEIFRMDLNGSFLNQPMVLADLVVLSEPYSVAVWNRSDWQLTQIQIPSDSMSMIVAPMDFQLWSDYVFCIVRLINGGIKLWAFSLAEAMNSSQSSSTVVLDPSSVSSLDAPFGGFRYSVYHDPWDLDQHTAVVSLVGNSAQGLVSARAIFDRSKESTARWTSVDIHYTRYDVWEDGRNNNAEGRYFIRPGSSLSRSGQLLVSVERMQTMQSQSPERRSERRFASFKRSGRVVLRRLSENVLSVRPLGIPLLYMVGC